MRRSASNHRVNSRHPAIADQLRYAWMPRGPAHGTRCTRLARQVAVKEVKCHLLDHWLRLARALVWREMVRAEELQVVADARGVRSIKLHAGDWRIPGIGSALYEQHRRRRRSEPR